MQDPMDVTVSEVRRHTQGLPSVPVAEDSKDIWGKGGRRPEIWTDKETDKLIQLVKINYSRFTGPKAWQALVWQEITTAIQGYLPGITQKQVQAKWRNLKHSYVRYEENKRATGKGAKKPPPHYHELAFLRGRVLIQPICLEEEGLDDDPPPFPDSSPTVSTRVQHSDTSSASPATLRVSTAATPLVFPASTTTVPKAAEPVTPTVTQTVSPGLDPVVTTTVTTAATPAVSQADSEGHAKNTTESHAPPPPPLRTRRRTRPPTVRESLDRTIKKLTDKIDSFIDFETELELRREEREKELHELDRILKREQIRILQLKRREMEMALDKQ